MDGGKHVGPDGEYIAGVVARVISQAVHDALLAEDMTKSTEGQNVIADALLDFARTLARHHFRGVDRLIEAAQLARHAKYLLHDNRKKEEA